VYVVDEAESSTPRQGPAAGADCGAKVVAVGIGGWFTAAREHTGGATLVDVRRQREGRELAALRAFRAGQESQALAGYAAAGSPGYRHPPGRRRCDLPAAGRWGVAVGRRRRDPKGATATSVVVAERLELLGLPTGRDGSCKALLEEALRGFGCSDSISDQLLPTFPGHPEQVARLLAP